MSDAPELQLEAAPAPKTERVKKGRDYKDYVPIYGRQIRTIKWWVEQGREKNDLPPLDDPLRMPEWWERVMTQRCPQGILDAARAAAAPAASGVLESQPAAAAPAMRSSFENPAITTQEQNLQHLKEQLDRARREQLEAQHEEPPDATKIEIKSRKWRELNAEVMKAEEAVFKLRSKQGKLVDMESLGATLLPIFITVANSVRSLRTRIKTRLAKASTEEEAEQIWQEGIDESFSELIANGYVTREQLALAA